MMDAIDSVELMEQTDRLTAKQVSLVDNCVPDDLECSGAQEARGDNLRTSFS